MSEAQVLLSSIASSERDVGFLLDEAFHGSRALKLFNEVDSSGGWDVSDPWAPESDSTRRRPGQVLLEELARDAHLIPTFHPRAELPRLRQRHSR